MRGGGDLKAPKSIVLAYTLAEIIIVMLIIAVIVSVSIGITKTKIDNVVSYTYYNAYSTLRKISTEMLSDWAPDDLEYKQARTGQVLIVNSLQDYIVNSFNTINAKISILSRYIINQPANAIVSSGGGNECVNYYWLSLSECIARGYTWCGHRPANGDLPPAANMCKVSFKCCQGGSGDITSPCSGKTCSSGSRLNTSTCECEKNPIEPSGPCSGKICLIGEKLNTSTCMCEKEKLCSGKTCPIGQILNLVTCRCEKFDPPSPCLGKTCPIGQKLDLSTCTCEKLPCTNKPSGPAPCGQHWDENTCSYVGTPTTCPEGYQLNSSTCTCEKLPCTNKPSKIPCGQSWDESTCSLVGSVKTCPSGQHLNSGCECVVDCPSDLTACQKCDSETGVVSKNPDVNRTCSDETYEWSEEQCKCILSPRTLPRKGENFCKLFETYANIKSGSSICSGSDISSGTTDFNDKEADITLRNGLLLYNLHKDAVAIPDLAHNTQGGSYDGVSNTNEWGYTVYVDIDGAKGDSQLWRDVYPFYITLSGKIIPAYDKSNPGLSGGDSTRHLAVSVENENYFSGKRTIKWLAKSVPFKEGACVAGYVGSDTPYCKHGTSYSQASECTDKPNSVCRVKQIQPVKFFF